jgi:alpha,alpha-trehalase
MKKISKATALIFVFIIAGCITPTKKTDVKTGPPAELYGQLFYDVQGNANIFADSKTFVDCVPLYNPKLIREKYSKLQDKSPASVKQFVGLNFSIPVQQKSLVTDSSQINMHIRTLWEKLGKPADNETPGTLIPLPHPYIVPGGRFREVYYWDSFFTMLGLKTDEKYSLMQNMVDNFSFLIEQYGFIPNGNRTYYLGRSQPPFYALMIKLLADIKSDSIYFKYLPYLEKEYQFWMDGSQFLTTGEKKACRRIVRMPGGEILNRYWDDKNTARPESFREDKKTLQEAIETAGVADSMQLFRNIRAAAESGWDFSSRWLSKDQKGNYNLSSIHTTDIIPVDLNALIYYQEFLLSGIYDRLGETKKSRQFKEKYLSRKRAILNYCWDQDEGFFMDYDYVKEKRTDIYSLAAVYPLFFRIATGEQARLVAGKIEELFLKPGGVITTLNETGQQWDSPNGWAPLQWITIKGLEYYHENLLAGTIKERWLNLNKDVYKKTFKMMEKYNVVDLSKEGGGGEYPSQDGFGWTNGVFQNLSNEENNK